MAVDPNDRDAYNRIKAQLAAHDLEGLADWYWEQLVAGRSEAEIALALYDRPEVQVRYPGLKALRDKGRAISFDEYRAIERQYVSMFRQAGLPEGFYDSPDDFGRFIANEVSPQEMSQRLEVARVALYELPPQVREEAQRLYGLGAGDVMAFLLDPTKALPVLQQQFTAAQASYAARASGFGMLTVNEAESLGYTGASFDELTRGFGELAESTELFAPIIGEANQDVIGRQEQLDAAFGGNANARRRIEKRARERVAQFSGGGGYAATREGVTGLGSAAS